MAITFDCVKTYLEAIANKGNLDARQAGHDRFWNVEYADFMSGVVPTKKCGGAPVPIINRPDMINSAFYQILQASWCTAPKMAQMPKTGPYITDEDYSVNLPDGTEVKGADILKNIGDWLTANAPEHG